MADSFAFDLPRSGLMRGAGQIYGCAAALSSLAHRAGAQWRAIDTACALVER